MPPRNKTHNHKFYASRQSMINPMLWWVPSSHRLFMLLQEIIHLNLSGNWTKYEIQSLSKMIRFVTEKKGKISQYCISEYISKWFGLTLSTILLLDIWVPNGVGYLSTEMNWSDLIYYIVPIVLQINKMICCVKFNITLYRPLLLEVKFLKF